MKKLKLLSLVGITSIALANAGWAAGHGGGGGGFGGGGGGRGGGGGHFGGGGRGGGVGLGLPAGRFGGGGPRVSGRSPDFPRRVALSRTKAPVFPAQKQAINPPPSGTAPHRRSTPS